MTSAGEEKAVFSAKVNYWLCCFRSKEFPLPLDAWERLIRLIVALPGPSICLFCLGYDP